MPRKRLLISTKIAWYVRGMLPLVTLMAAQAATGIDDAMPPTIPPQIIADWEAQDASAAHTTKAQIGADIDSVVKKLNPPYSQLVTNDSTKTSYYKACHYRRVSRLIANTDQIQKILYARHHDLGGSGVGYLEEMQNDQFTSGMGKFGSTGSTSGGGYTPGGALLLLTFQNYYPSPTTLVSDQTGCIRDPSVSLSGNKVAFAWSKDNNGYHIYEMSISNPDSVRQLTNDPWAGVAVSDFQPCYLPNGDILFNSSRCFSQTTVATNIVSNMFLMNKDGKYLRRIGFDMGHTFYPTLRSDASVLYSRWEFNDRNRNTCFGMFWMKMDGAFQTEMWGNQASWPVAIYQGREIPGNKKEILAIIGGHTGASYCGDLAVLSPSNDRNLPSAVKLIAPIRTNPTDPNLVTGVEDSARHFQDPYPLDNNDWFLISYRKNITTDKLFKIYYMNRDGKRELLAWDSAQSVSQPQLLTFPKYRITAYDADYDTLHATCKLINAYYGMGMDSLLVKIGTVKKIRIIGLEHPVDPTFGDVGPAGKEVMTPVARYGGTVSAKKIIGESDVFDDGTANFYVPPRTPLYFQLIDSAGCLVQTMRSYITLMPGQKNQCAGCHENKNAITPLPPERPQALNPTELDAFNGIKNDYLSFRKYIQPIFTSRCAPCHIDSSNGGLNLKGDTIWTGNLTDPINKNACRFWCKSYLNVTDSAKQLVSVIDNNSAAEGIKPYTYGSGKSKLITRLKQGMHGSAITKKEIAMLSAWIDLGIPHGGKYNDDMLPADSTKYETRLKRRLDHVALEQQNIDEFRAVGQYKSYTAIGDWGWQEQQSGRQIANASALKARFTKTGSNLLVKIPSEGLLSLIDLRGRKVFSAIISKEEFQNQPERSFHLRASAGLYILKFKGTNIVTEKTVPIF